MTLKKRIYKEKKKKRGVGNEKTTRSGVLDKGI